MDVIKYDSEMMQIEAQAYLDSFKARMKKTADEIIGELYSNVMPYLDTDTWTNYREALRLELEHEYKYSKFKCAWAKNFRRAVLVENRDKLVELLNHDLLERIKTLEDRHQEFEMFRYSPGGDAYQDVVKERDELKKLLNK